MDTASAPDLTPAIAQPIPAVVAKPRGVTLTVLVFTVAVVALLASAVALSIVFTEVDGHYMWLMVMMAVVIIIILLAGVFLPFLKEVRHHRQTTERG